LLCCISRNAAADDLLRVAAELLSASFGVAMSLPCKLLPDPDASVSVFVLVPWDEVAGNSGARRGAGTEAVVVESVCCP